MTSFKEPKQQGIAMSTDPSAVDNFSLVRNDALFRLQRKLGLIPENGSGILRRAVIYALICWLPVAVWAAYTGHLLPDSAATESLLGHYGLHVRCLLAIPLLVIAEAVAHSIVPTCLNQFLRTGLVDEKLEPAFREIIAAAVRLRDQVYPWVIIAAFVMAWTIAVVMAPNPDELAWTGHAGVHNFGTAWFLFVIRPLFSVLLLAWVWRLVLASIVLFRISRLPLNLVPAHPDRVGGLGFIDRLPRVFSPMAFSISAVVAASWGHNVIYHGVQVPSLYIEMGALLGVLAILLLTPMMFLTPLLAKTKKQAMRDYGVLLAQHGRKVHQRWIQGETVEDTPLLDAPELGPAADIQTLYEAVRAMRTIVFGKASLIAVLLPTAIPILIVVATQWPLKKTLTKLLMTLL
jgi:hypothetical protein